MYTQCPECQTAFRVTVEVLQKAGGRVRCGGCGKAFSALENLSTGVPGTASNPSAADKETPAEEQASEDFDAKSKALLETLDELAGPDDIIIEDTGVEWRVLDESETSDNVADSQSAQAEERRYDDDTELPDDFADEQESPYIPDTPQRRSTDVEVQQTEFDTHQVDLALDGDETWAELLDADEDMDEDEGGGDAKDDFAQQLEAAEAQQLADDSALLPQLAADLADSLHRVETTAGAELPLEVEEELAAIHSELTAVGNDDDRTTAPDDLDTQFNLQAEELGLEGTHNDELDSPAGGDSDDQPAEEEVDLVDDPDELSPEEEADIVQKLRDSTGSFQIQIAAAQQALDSGDVDEYRMDDDVVQEEPHVDDAEDEALSLADDEVVDDEPEEPVEEEILSDDDIRSQFDAGLLEPEPDDDRIDEKAEDESGSEPEEPEDEKKDPSERDALSATMIQAGLDPSVLSGGNMETIVMEGDLIRGSLDLQDTEKDDNSAITGLDEQQSLVDTYMLNKGQTRGGRRRTDPASYGMMAGIAILLVLLAAQILHASRQTFATYGAFNQTIGPLYRALGNPVTPRWDIKGWQFESTSGSTDENDEVLTVFSRVRNNAEDPLPYPLLHVSLTDRWEDIIGSKILEPGDYLAGDMDPRKPVAPGESFTAVIAIERPSVDATGFQLYVCYRLSPGTVRCATEDFKD